jgi:hypothetical protein
VVYEVEEFELKINENLDKMMEQDKEMNEQFYDAKL